MSELETLNKIAWIIGASIMVLGGAGCVAIIGAWSLHSIIRYRKWRRLQVLQSRIYKEG